jgi:DNA-binding GntR family transcriptional regulator
MPKRLKNQRISPKADSPSLSGRIYRKLFQAIVTGEISGETRLVAATLAHQFGVSTTPVRESLLRLASEGLIRPIPRVGYIVEAMTAQDAIDLFDARIGIERLVARLAVEKITPAEIEALEENLKQMNAVLGRGSTERMLELDSDFHQFIARVARNKTLLSVSQLVNERTYRFRCACLRVTNIAERTRDGHAEIVRALKEKNAEAVDRAMLAHLEQIKGQVYAYLEQLPHNSRWPILTSP